MPVKKEYKPGDTVETSGIYKVTHDSTHPEEHEVTCVKGEPFPPCRTCKHPRFVLVHAAAHVHKHKHFMKK